MENEPMQEKTGKSLFTVPGKCSEFGGQHDHGVSITEGLAIFTEGEAESAVGAGLTYLTFERPGLGLARRLNPRAFYCAMRWDYARTPRKLLQRAIVRVRAASGLVVWCHPADWGPNERTGRVIDLSPGARQALHVSTDDEVTAELFV